MESLHDSKNADYASDGNPYSNFEEAAQTSAGFAGVDAVFASLIGVKLARLRELTRAGKTPNHEGIQDTRRDLAMYAALWASYYEAVPDSGISNATFIANERAQPTNNQATNRAIVARNTATISPTATRDDEDVLALAETLHQRWAARVQTLFESVKTAPLTDKCGASDMTPRPRPTYDDLRGPDLQPCRCGRLYTHPDACDTAEKCLALDHPHAK